MFKYLSFFGLLNIGVAAATLHLLRDSIPRRAGLRASCAAAAVSEAFRLAVSVSESLGRQLTSETIMV